MKKEHAIDWIKKSVDKNSRLWKAIESLIPELSESKDERIRRKMIDHFKSKTKETWYNMPVKDIIAYLEKQKEQKPIVSKPKTSLEILKHYLVWAENSEEDCPYTWKELAAAIKDGIAALEQKPVEYLSKRKVYDIMNKLTELSTSDLIPIESKEYVKIHEITSDVCSLLDYPIEQKLAEWSEEDENMYKMVGSIVHGTFVVETQETKDKLFSWLKSLRPQPHKEIYQAVKHDLAIRFMNYLDKNRPEGKMNLSNGECEDIDKAFKENDWAKITRYVEKYRPHWKSSNWRRYIWTVNLRFDYDGLVRYGDNGSYEIVTAGNKPKRQVGGEYILLKDISSTDWKPSEEQMEALGDAYVEANTFKNGDILESLYNDLKKLK